MKQLICLIAALFLLQMTAFASMDAPETAEESPFDLESQLDALGRAELERQVPEGARELMRRTGTLELSPGQLLQLSPRDFFASIWQLLLDQVKKPSRTFASVLGTVTLCSLVGGLKTAAGEDSLSQTFTTIAVLCVLVSVVKPIFDCISETCRAIEDTALFMLTYIPMFSAAIAASGSPVTGTTYNLFLFSACQVVSQVVAKTLVPLMGVYLALCITASLVPDLNISSATASIKSIISWALGFFLTVFVGLLSVQSMVAQSADTVTVKAAKFMLGSLVPVVGSALSDAYTAAQGCLKLIKTTLGAYGIFVAAFTFLPILLRSVIWYALTNLAVVGADIIGVPRVSSILKSCGSVLGILIAVILCFALLVIVSTAVVMVTGMGAG